MTRIELREQHVSRWIGLLQDAQTSGLTIKLLKPEFLIQIRDSQVAVNQGFAEEDLMKLFR